ncbi:hypothetical protein, partial [Eubacterium callanderi]|uniref:hypothetical protein n=1 Tax=Eubacterium callanderi TaxID=53442 RepID=UPI002109ACE8
PSLLLGLVLRKPVIRLNHTFTEKLESTHLMYLLSCVVSLIIARGRGLGQMIAGAHGLSFTVINNKNK